MKISNNAKRYIQNYKKCCSNELVSVIDKKGNQPIEYREWLTIEDAESACLVERKYVISEVKKCIMDNLSMFDITDANGYTIDVNDIVHLINKKLIV